MFRFANCISLVLLSALATVLGSGCAPRDTLMGVQDQARLEHRATSLLLRAAQSEFDVVRANAFEALVQVAPDGGRPYFRSGLTASSPLVRFAACCALGDIRDAGSREKLEQRLSDSDAIVRLGAAYALCRLGDATRARLLVQTLNDHKDKFLRSEAAYRIGKIGEPKAIPWLQFAANREKSGRVLAHIYAALAMLGNEEAVLRLIGYLQGDRATRLVALQALRETPSSRSVEPLRYMLADANDHVQPRLLAARALGRAGSNAGFELARRAITRTAEDQTQTMQIRMNAALALGAIGDPRALRMLQHVAESDSDPRTQVAACWAICEIVNSPLGS